MFLLRDLNRFHRRLGLFLQRRQGRFSLRLFLRGLGSRVLRGSLGFRNIRGVRGRLGRLELRLGLLRLLGCRLGFSLLLCERRFRVGFFLLLCDGRGGGLVGFSLLLALLGLGLFLPGLGVQVCRGKR